MSNTIPPDVRSCYLEAFKRFYDDDWDDVTGEESQLRGKILSAATRELATHAPADALDRVYLCRSQLLTYLDHGWWWHPDDVEPPPQFQPSMKLRRTQAALLIVSGGVAYALSSSLWLTALVLGLAYVRAHKMQQKAKRNFDSLAALEYPLWNPAKWVSECLGLEPRHFTSLLADLLYKRHYREHPELYPRKAAPRPATRSTATTEWAPATAATWAVADTATSRDYWEDDDPLALPNELMHPQVNLNGMPMLNEGVDVMGNPWGTTSI